MNILVLISRQEVGEINEVNKIVNVEKFSGEHATLEAVEDALGLDAKMKKVLALLRKR